ncbi:putative 1,4-beta-D-glucan cellobiohydrolase C [Cytospora mali]|uniref:1,4-beta-D-glucan cellobiohydrolase C n=1 Tax=Cytospora mali TaxID=578113 RepID=A0A194UMR7_CYTMA|nr:putative 1,4-beta-D-glucan cellobiohydrolase C [Valsa mali var. pyri (nom. inval.)]
MGRTFFALASLALGATAQSTAGAYGQCGGSGYTGATACGSGYTCTTYNPYYAQCYPDGTTSSAVTSTTSGSTRTPTSTTTSSGSITTTVSTTQPTTTLATSTTVATGTGSGTPTTLVSGWYWIRGVETPYYHSYLQTLPTGTPGDALMDSYETAGQFNIIDGQLVYNTGSGTTDALYMHVEDPTNKTQRALATWFNATENTYGSFAFSGDTVTWTDPDVSRPNTAAFYVCPGNSTTAENALFVNTGAYLYDTPSGCYDVDIHSYGASTASL